MAHFSDWAMLIARTAPDAPKHQGITYFVLDMRSPGVTVRPLREMTGSALFNDGDLLRFAAGSPSSSWPSWVWPEP
ncbi:hypothetical protein ACOCJ7_05740 [Knoellia sp. CPCC 206453]|uniref:hypothetical protein n=1 Tax=Knoellia pratensis TaxID=3404796 RepID=UPI003619EF4B